MTSATTRPVYPNSPHAGFVGIYSVGPGRPRPEAYRILRSLDYGQVRKWWKDEWPAIRDQKRAAA